MSVVTTLMIHVATLEDYGQAGEGGVTMETVNAWLKERSPGYWLCRLDDAPVEHWGGSKAPQVDLWAGAFNTFSVDEEDFLVFLAGLCWAYPEHVQVFVNHEEDDHMHLLMLTPERTWRELVDGGQGGDCWAYLDNERLVTAFGPR